MPDRARLLEDVAHADGHVATLVAQVGAAPNELQLVLETARLDVARGGLLPQNAYIVRALGVLEHRISGLGMTAGDLAIHEQHPLLGVYVEPVVAVFFRGQARDVPALVAAIVAAHRAVLGDWRPFPQFLADEVPLAEHLAGGGGLLGQMPATLASEIVPLLVAAGLEVKQAEEQAYVDRHDHPALRAQRPKALVIGESWVVAYDFAVDGMRRQGK
jgi:hypothetical protein